MSLPQIYSGQASASNMLTRTGREMHRLASRVEVSSSLVNYRGDLAVVAQEALDRVAGRALTGVAQVSQMEAQLAALVPMAATRLQAIGDAHALGSVTNVMNFAQSTR